MNWHFYVCSSTCLSGFREDKRDEFIKAGVLAPDNKCHCGGTFEQVTAEQALGPGVVQRRTCRGND